MLSLVSFALAIVIGTGLALLALKVATRRLAGGVLSAVILGGQIGAAAMTLPGFWLSSLVGAPFFGGMAIQVAGSRAMQFGVLLGASVTQFVCVALGSTVGVLVALGYVRVAHRPGAGQ